MPRYAKAVMAGFFVAVAVSGLLGLIASAGGADPGFTPALVGMIFGAFTAYIMANLAGNRKGVAASDAAKAAAVSFRAPPGRGLLIVYREGFVGRAAGMNILVDGATVTQLKSPRFAAVPLDAGQHRLEAVFGGLAGDQNRGVGEGFALGLGEVVAYEATIGMGAVKNTIRLRRVSVDDALAERLQRTPMTALETAAPAATVKSGG